MNRFGTRLRELRESARLKQVELAKKAGVSQSAIVQWEAGNRSPGVEHARKLAEALGVSVDELLKEPEGIPPPPKKGRPKKNLKLLDPRIPWQGEIRVYGRVPCGPPEPSPEGGVQPVYLIDVGTLYGDTTELFGVIATGTSMTAAKIEEGDLIIIRADRNPDVGRQVLACIREQDYTIKKLVTRDGQRMLESCDGKKSRIEVNEDVTFIGRVVGSLRGYIEPEAEKAAEEAKE